MYQNASISSSIVSVINQGCSDGGYIGIYTLPKSVTESYFVH